MKNIRPRWERALNLGALVVGLIGMAGGLDATNLCPSSSTANCLWNNGTVTTTGSGVGSDYVLSGFTVFDNFTVAPAGWIVSGFNITDFFSASSPNQFSAEYKSTNWSLWSGNPLTTGKLVASNLSISSSGSVGNVTGNCSVACLGTITVNFASGILLLPNTTYYLGTSNVLADTNGIIDATQRASAAGHAVNGISTANGWESSNGSISGSTWNMCSQCTSDNNPTTDTAFEIIGTPAPEPGTLLWTGIALAGLGYKSRRRKA